MQKSQTVRVAQDPLGVGFFSKNKQLEELKLKVREIEDVVLPEHNQFLIQTGRIQDLGNGILSQIEENRAHIDAKELELGGEITQIRKEFNQMKDATERYTSDVMKITIEHTNKMDTDLREHMSGIETQLQEHKDYMENMFQSRMSEMDVLFSGKMQEFKHQNDKDFKSMAEYAERLISVSDFQKKESAKQTQRCSSAILRFERLIDKQDSNIDKYAAMVQDIQATHKTWEEAITQLQSSHRTWEKSINSITNILEDMRVDRAG